MARLCVPLDRARADIVIERLPHKGGAVDRGVRLERQLPHAISLLPMVGRVRASYLLP
jgi:hypothetical protein